MQWQHAAFCSRCAIPASGTASGAWRLDSSGRRRLCQHCYDASVPVAAAEGPPGAAAGSGAGPPAAAAAVHWFTQPITAAAPNFEALLAPVVRIGVLGMAHAGSCQVSGTDWVGMVELFRHTCLGLTRWPNLRPTPVQLPPRQCSIAGCSQFKAAAAHTFDCDDLNCRFPG